MLLHLPSGCATGWDPSVPSSPCWQPLEKLINCAQPVQGVAHLIHVWIKEWGRGPPGEGSWTVSAD